MKPEAVLLAAFDAQAGSQRVASHVFYGLKSRNIPVSARLGFGRTGFVSEIPNVKTFLRIDSIPFRKLLYPIWVLAENIRGLLPSSANRLVWANAVYALPCALIDIFLRPRNVVIHIHEVEFPRIYRSLIDFALKRGSTVICVSDFQKQRLGLDAKVLPNCVDFSAEAPTTRNRVIFVGSVSKSKGLPLFIEVAKELTDTSLEFWAFLPKKEQTAEALNLYSQLPRVQFVFGETIPANMYKNGFLLIQATDSALWTETFSLVSAEAINCLVPVASAGAEVISEIAGKALAFDCPDRDPHAIASMIRALERDPVRHQQLVAACASQRSNFSFETFSGRIEQLVLQTLEAQS